MVLTDDLLITVASFVVTLFLWIQSRSKQMKNLSPPSPHFNDEKKKEEEGGRRGEGGGRKGEGGGGQKKKFLKQQKKNLLLGVWIFSGTTQLIVNVLKALFFLAFERCDF